MHILSRFFTPRCLTPRPVLAPAKSLPRTPQRYRGFRIFHSSTRAMPPKSLLIVGAHRGLGYALVKRYAELMGSEGHIYATVEQPVDKCELLTASPLRRSTVYCWKSANRRSRSLRPSGLPRQHHRHRERRL
jgi:hypothetical protein